MLKSITIIIFLCFICFVGNAQSEITPPTVVKETFKSMYPSTSIIEIESDNDDFEYEFNNGDHKMSATFSKSGDWLESEWSISKSELPLAVQDLLAKKYSNYKIVEVEKIESPQLTSAFEIELKREGLELEILVDPSGEVINIEKESEDDEGEDDKG